MTLPKFHYGFVVAGVTFMVLLIGAGMRAVPGVFVVPFETEFGWSRATISLAVGVCIGLYGLMAPFSAATMDRFGVRGTMIGALCVIGAGVALLPLMTQSWQLILLWGVFVGSGIGFVANVLAAIVATRWFVSRRGLVMGMLTSATAAGQLLFLPPLAIIAATYGWRSMVGVLAVAILCLIPLVALLMRNRPEDIGLRAYGETAEAKPPERTTGNPIRNAFRALGFGLRHRDFYLLAGTFFVCGASTNGLIGTHLIPACIDNGIPEIMAASLLASMAIFNFIGATGSGYLSDRVDCRVLLCVYYGLRGLSLLFLPFSFDTFYTLSLFAVFYGLDWIATIPPTVQADRPELRPREDRGDVWVDHVLSSIGRRQRGVLRRCAAGQFRHLHARLHDLGPDVPDRGDHGAVHRLQSRAAGQAGGRGGVGSSQVARHTPFTSPRLRGEVASEASG